MITGEISISLGSERTDRIQDTDLQTAYQDEKKTEYAILYRIFV